MQVCAGSLFSEQRNAALERVLKTIALKSIPVKFVIHFVFIMILPDNDEMIIVMTIPDILRTWNLDQYASAFQSNCIEVDELQTLLEPEWKDVLHSLIPVPGHRMRFVKNLKELIKEGKSESIENNNNDLKQSRVNDRNENTIPSSSKSETSNLSLKNIRETSESISSKKRSRESNEPNVIRGEQLRLLLSKSATGRCILQLAKQGPCLKQDKDRNKLTEIIIEDELSKSEKISTAGFAELVDAIQHIFPEEDSDLYFIPYKYSNGRKLLAKGKLITKYYSIRKEFKALGIITQNKDQLDSETQDSQDDLEDDGLQGKLNFLEENIEPWSTIVEYWTDTSKLRIAKLHAKSRIINRIKGKDNNKGNANVKGKFKSRTVPETTQVRQEKKEVENISTYMNKYPALKEKLGYTLFEIDFDLLYPEQKLKAYNSYQDFCDRIIQALKNEESKCEAVKDNLLLLTSDEISEETKNLVALLSLCYLDTVVTVARQSGNGHTWRPPHTEIQEGVISLIESVGKLQTFMQERKKKLINWGITMQPYVLVCGSSMDDIDACYVILDTETQFLVQSPIRALDLCFKIIHAAHLEYSPESYRLWRLIQKELYELTTEFDGWKSDAQLPKLFKKIPQSSIHRHRDWPYKHRCILKKKVHRPSYLFFFLYTNDGRPNNHYERNQKVLPHRLLIIKKAVYIYIIKDLQRVKRIKDNLILQRIETKRFNKSGVIRKSHGDVIDEQIAMPIKIWLAHAKERKEREHKNIHQE